MENLLQTVGYYKLIASITHDDVLATRKMIPVKRHYDVYDVAIAYLAGIRQGIHNERARRKQKGAAL